MAKTEKIEKKAETKAVATMGPSVLGATYIKRPRVTEKSGLRSETEGVYTFEVTPGATKTGIKQAIVEMFKVSPVKVNITKTPAKKVFARGRRGKKSGVKKAVIYLKKGDKIDFI